LDGCLTQGRSQQRQRALPPVQALQRSNAAQRDQTISQ
jgi:hypothetical protein